MLTYYSDGYTIRANPSNAGGFVVADKEGSIVCHKHLVGDIQDVSVKTITNNEMELLGLLYACMYAPDNSLIETDSRNNIAWIKNPKSKARPDLMPVAKTIKILQQAKNLSIIWRPRETNKAGIWIENNNFELM